MADTPTIYIVTDIRTVPHEGGYAVLVNTTQHQSRNGAEERYHTALAAAARSEQYPVYSAIMATNEGFVIASQSYTHEVAPAPAEDEAGE
ncbi:MAG: hypothetical protein IKE20_07205 [Eggerthellaceae bacterium]|nr:hypothetical protein [Eggerthellaceae bacterium]